MSLPHIFGPLTGQVPLANLDDNFNALVSLVSTSVAPAGTNNFRLVLSGGNLTLQPVNGNNVDINGTIYSYTAMPILSASGLTPATLYYIYLTDILGIATLEASATGYTTDAKGRDYKTGDPTRRLVGQGYPTAGPAWTLSNAQALVRTRNNRVTVVLSNAFAANRQTASATFVELSNTERVEFLCWSDEAWPMHITGSVNNNAVGGQTFCCIGCDNVNATDGGIELDNPTGLTLNSMSLGITTILSGMTDGFHYATILGRVGSGTATWQGSATVGGRVSLQGVIVPIS